MFNPVDALQIKFASPPKDPESLSNAIMELLSNDTLSKHMGEKARLLAEKSFQISSVVDDHYSLYQRLL